MFEIPPRKATGVSKVVQGPFKEQCRLLIIDKEVVIVESDYSSH